MKVLGFSQNGKLTEITAVPTDTTASSSAVTPTRSGFQPKPCVTTDFFNTIIRASHAWRVYDVKRLVVNLNLGHLQVTYNGQQQAITKVLDAAHQYSFATMISVVWRGGPDCRNNMRSNLSHWMLDTLMWEVRLKQRATNNGRQYTARILDSI